MAFDLSRYLTGGGCGELSMHVEGSMEVPSLSVLSAELWPLRFGVSVWFGLYFSMEVLTA